MHTPHVYRTAVKSVQDELQLRATDPTTGQPYEFWATGTWYVNLRVRRWPATPRSFDYPGDPGDAEYDVLGAELDECQVWIPQEYIDNGAVQIDLSQAVRDGNGMVEITPTPEQESLVNSAFDVNRFENSLRIEDIPDDDDYPDEPEPDDDARWEYERRRHGDLG